MSEEFSEHVEVQRSSIDAHEDDLLEKLYRQMRQIREFEKTADELGDAGEIPGQIHLYLGQEAVAVGTCATLDEDDIIGSTHRGHGHVLAKGADIEKMLAELLGKETGLNDGRGGSMHMVDFSLGIFGCNAIVGASVPHVAGGVLSATLDGDDRIGVAFFGDGAINEGVVMETLNLASVWELPMVFLCENNQYAVSTPQQDAVAGDQIADRAAGFDIESEVVNGQNVLAVYDAVADAVEQARANSRPRLVECETYRYSGHFSGEDALLSDRPYREDAEVEEWRRERDPVRTFRTALVDAGVRTEDQLDEIDATVEETLAEARSNALESEYPPSEKAYEDVYTNQLYQNFPAGTYR